jgi:PAS domain S-box-containing protein
MLGPGTAEHGPRSQPGASKPAESHQRPDEEELRRITDLIAQSIIVLNPDGNPIYANRFVLDYFGLTLEEVQAEGFRERVFHPEDVARLRDERRKRLRANVPFENEQRSRGKDGKYRWFLIRYNPLLDAHGKVVRWYATGTDIDDRKRVEDRMRNETVALREDIVRSSMFEEVVGTSNALREVLAQVAKVAPTDSSVLIEGETGTGKELVARAIHHLSSRAARAFIRVNCAAIPSALFASELFGHEKGAFTGALHRRLGRFESADAGTIFLDEVGELPPEIQVALLRVLQEREIERVGGNQSIAVDVRVIAATNRDLRAAVAAGNFREDLFYRLNVVPLRLPPLRERVGDIRLLTEYLVERYSRKSGKRIAAIAKETIELFEKYAWPGNIRELQNVIERAVILADNDCFAVDPNWLPVNSPAAARSPTLRIDLTERERIMIEDALRATGGTVAGPRGAAARLGVPRQTLESRLRKLGINAHRFKAGID